MRELVIPPYLPLVAAEAIKKLEERMAVAKSENVGKLLLDQPVRRKSGTKPRGR